jgi:8-oxo-dGTP diphosphatase
MSKPDLIYLVRHAKAGERRLWESDDEARPLSKLGHRQSEAIAERLMSRPVSTLHSSPYVRCVQTLEPLAARLGTEVRHDDRLAEAAPFEPVLELLAEVDAGAVLCSHGDIIPEVIQALHRRGMEVKSAPDWRKGTIWVLKRKHDRITTGKVWPPPK